MGVGKRLRFCFFFVFFKGRFVGEGRFCGIVVSIRRRSLGIIGFYSYRVCRVEDYYKIFSFLKKDKNMYCF